MTKKLKIGVYSPYLDTVGGGEKYMLTIAEILSEDSEVDFLLGTHLYQADIESIKHKIKLLHGLDLSGVKFVKSPIGKDSSFFERHFFLRKYDFIFYLTDGSIFLSTAKKSIIHFQVPLKNQLKNNFWNNLKIKSWQTAIYNSNFTKDLVEKEWPFLGKVIYPPVSVDKFVSKQKKKQILSVGRFFGYLKDKKHEVLIGAFKRLIDQNKTRDWSLHLVGVTGPGDDEYIEALRKKAGKYPIFLHPNLSFDDLIKLYGESSIYWHAAGFNENDPAKMEHFGISTVEAMAAECVPVVINKGGQREIVEDDVSGLLWENIEQLVKMTLSLIDDSEKLKKLAENAKLRSEKFSKEKFKENILDLIYG